MNNQWNQREIEVDETKLKPIGKKVFPVAGEYVIRAYPPKASLFKRIVDKVKGWLQS